MQRDFDIDVVVCTHERPLELARCLASLERQVRLPRCVIVSASRGGEYVTPPISLKVEVVRVGPSLPAQRNAAVPLVHAELVAFVDDDVELAPGYLETMHRWFVDHDACVGVSGNIRNDGHRPRGSRWYRAVFALGNDDGRLRRSGDGDYLHHPERPTRVEFLSGSNMVYRRRVIESLRFDEELQGYAYMEDVDFSLRASLLGELWMVADADLVHHRTATARVPQREYVRQVFTNGAYLFGKHRTQFGLQWLAFVRRLVGRAVAYLFLSVVRRSPEPAAGVVSGVIRVPRMVAKGASHAGR